MVQVFSDLSVVVLLSLSILTKQSPNLGTEM